MRSSRKIAFAAGLAAVGWAGLATAQIQVNGTLAATTNGVQDVTGTFECAGDNPCAGTFRITARENNCSNAFVFVGRIVLDGTIAPAAPGPVTARVNFEGADYDFVHNADGSCTIIPSSTHNHTETVAGSFDGRRGFLFNSVVDMGDVLTLRLDYSVDVAPVFAMTVQASIGVSATATATITARPQDIGTNASVYVFAYAPRAKVLPRAPSAEPTASAKADATLPCVLAQLNAAGQLVAVSADAMQAYVSGVLSANGQAVSILNGVPTVQIAGATFLVGYGSTSAAMIAGNVNRSAVSVPGAVQCKAERPQTGWWWNPAEGGRGFSIEARGNQLFFASYLYDASGAPLWYVAIGGTQLDGAAFQSNLLLFTGGQTLTGGFRTNQAQASPGQVALTFQDASHGILTWPGGSIPIERFPIVAGGPALPAVTNQPEAGWWWNDAEPGRGFFIEWQGRDTFIASYMYSAGGAPVWYASLGQAPDIRAYSGAWLQFGGGQTLTGAYHAATLTNANAGSVSVRFLAPDAATMTMPDGRVIPLRRFVF